MVINLLILSLIVLFLVLIDLKMGLKCCLFDINWLFLRWFDVCFLMEMVF